MSQLVLSIPPHEATKSLFVELPARRMRDVIEKRFGLKGGKQKTLQTIGDEYKITRERVRQIEADALKHLRRMASRENLGPLYHTFIQYLQYHQGVMGEARLLADAGPVKSHPHVILLLNISSSFTHLPETVSCVSRWALDTRDAARLEEMLERVVQRIAQDKRLVSEEQLFLIALESAKDTYGVELPREVVASHIEISTRIRKNPYGEYGLSEWPQISPSGVKDKAYGALAKADKPLHFREVAQAIDRAGWSKRRAHPQTVHNELIKDGRFVLVGRGLYALKEWGYEPGSVRDIMVAALKGARRPLSREEIISSALQKRHVKVPTILLNLQNQSVFKRTEDGKYMLA